MRTSIDAVDAAIDHLENGQPGLALEVLEPLCDDGLAAASPAATVSIAAALFVKGLILFRQDRLEDAFRAHRDCVRRHGHLFDYEVMWPTVLRIRAGRARTVLFDYRHASPGVAVELELLQSLGRTGDTVVIVGDETARANMRAQWPAFARVQLPDEPWPG